MLSDADLVMVEIEYKTQLANGDFDNLGPVPMNKLTKDMAAALLKHLYELHRLRDAVIHNDIEDNFYFGVEVGLKLWEMQ